MAPASVESPVMDSNRPDPRWLAADDCHYCLGAGERKGHGGSRLCECVWRRVFRACLGRYRACREEQGSARDISLELCGGHGPCFGRKRDEYLADFELVARRHLDERDFQVFEWFFLLSAGWRAGAGAMKMDRGNFFHAVYAIEARLGRVFLELEPHGLFPPEYFSGWRLDPDPVRKSARCAA
jgi:hypothetical protein